MSPGAFRTRAALLFGYDAAPREVFKANRTPGRAAAALHHGLISPEIGTTPEAVVKAPKKWVKDVYAPALMRIDALTDAERESVARDLSRFTGFPLVKIDRKTLYFSPQAYFNDGVLPGQSVNNFDMRQINPRVAGGARHAATNPIVTLCGRPDICAKTSNTGPILRTSAGSRPVIRQSQGHRRVPTSPTPWNYNTPTITPQMRAEQEAGEGPAGTDAWNKRAAKLNPRLRFLIGAGLYDALNAVRTTRS